jgi:predicted acylesterase/phospholipase RssA
MNVAQAPQQSSTDPFPWTLEVALSGGGLRASAYALGALLYLVHSGLNEKVKNIASVSGGSITNAFVASYCDFKNVDAKQFEEIVRPLAKKIAYRGLLQTWQSWAWAIAVGIVALLIFASYLYSPYPLAMTLVLSLSLFFLLYWRSWPIDKWMETIVPPAVTFGSLPKRCVDHVFCATDLRFGQPFFFSTADGGRLFSLNYGRADEPNLPLVRAVRASAAFPPAIPPISIKIETPRTFEFGMDVRTSKAPVRVWLTDGGAFNNFGSEWHRLRGELHIAQTAYFLELKRQTQNSSDWHRERYGQVQLVVDASRADEANRLYLLWLPIIGFLAYVYRTMNVMYGSTLAGRSNSWERAASLRMRKYPWKWLAKHSKSAKFESSFKDHSESYDPKKDYDIEKYGALKLYVPHARPFDHIKPFWLTVLPDETVEDFQRPTDWIDSNRGTAREMGAHWPWTGEQLMKPKHKEVSTTFRKLGYRATLDLIVEGYFKTREVLFWSFGYEGPPIPKLKDFEDLLKCGPTTTDRPWVVLSAVGRMSEA